MEMDGDTRTQPLHHTHTQTHLLSISLLLLLFTWRGLACSHVDVLPLTVKSTHNMYSNPAPARVRGNLPAGLFSVGSASPQSTQRLLPRQGEASSFEVSSALIQYSSAAGRFVTTSYSDGLTMHRGGRCCFAHMRWCGFTLTRQHMVGHVPAARRGPSGWTLVNRMLSWM